ncbi:hypothetical protein [Carboxydothermus islandicus]|uniref:hypothetical protein n=1 Tax=Carboxydothermus islandicus TaxID=661089 RepID=UPI00096A332E|nr:hypothetical protein [Carboxydothermus islandicus]
MIEQKIAGFYKYKIKELQNFGVKFAVYSIYLPLYIRKINLKYELDAETFFENMIYYDLTAKQISDNYRDISEKISKRFKLLPDVKTPLKNFYPIKLSRYE